MGSQVPKAEREEMVRLYRQGLSARQVSERTYWSRDAVRNALLAEGVEMRTRNTAHPRPQISIDETLKRTELYGQGYSLDEVARMCGRTPRSIAATLKREGVKIRSKSEANRLAWANGRTHKRRDPPSL